VITGGGSGIGAATVRRFVAGGYHVAVLDVLAAERPEEANPAVRYFPVDVREPEAVAAALSEAEGDFGPVDVLVNNAGVISEAPLLELSVAEFERIMSVNVTGVFVCTQAAARCMRDSGTRGRIVNLGSINSLSISTSDLAHYAASKGAVLMLTKASALELAPYGIRVNAVGPGVVETPLVRAVFEDASRKEHFLRRIPRGQITTPEDVAETIFALADPRLAAITGQLVLIDGGELIGGARIDA
jgi:NAD(P)-dependent dehydrogenase (short-subunit alcohol dehydrogenase family)